MTGSARIKTIPNGTVRLQPLLPLAHRRTFLTDSLPPYILAPTVFIGLSLTLWLYKCVMMVIFQDKIIYMPYIPPFARSEKVEDYARMCKPVEWRQVEVRAEDGARLGVCVGEIGKSDEQGGVDGKTGFRGGGKKVRSVVICYFHGNGGSLPPRLPMLSSVLKSINAHRVQHKTEMSIEYTLAALSYRGYWTSTGRPSQRGIEQDAQAMLRWANETYSGHGNTHADVELILWGQSIGAGVATTAAATYSAHCKSAAGKPAHITGVVLETPFTSIKSMLQALYPQTWLPYRYLWPFLRSHWDSEAALGSLASSDERQKPRLLLVVAEKDEVVPAGEAEKLEKVCHNVGLKVKVRRVRGALHNEATVRREGREGIAEFVVRIAEERRG